MKPLCGCCGGHHYPEEPHPAEAVREALAELRRTEPPVSEIEVGRKTFAEVRGRVTETPAVTPEPVTKAPVPRDESPESVTKGRPRQYASRAEQQRAYRERRQEG